MRNYDALEDRFYADVLAAPLRCIQAFCDVELGVTENELAEYARGEG